jgi:N-acetylglucosamine-6-sulfatase
VKPCEYEECHRVPLWIRYARGVGHRDGRLVGNVDLASTFADLAGTRPTIGQDGRSLVPILDGSVGTWRDALLLVWLGETAPGKQSAAPPYWAIRTTRYKYVELATGEKELYDLQVDPYELRNVSGVAAYAQVESDLAARLARLKG